MGSAERTYFACWVRLGGEDGYLVWFDGGASAWDDGVWIDEAGRAPVFPTVAGAHTFAARHGVQLEEHGPPLLNDLDLVVRWLADPRPDTVDCVEFLNAWNLFGDVARSVGAEFDPDIGATRWVYDKLFWGNNLPAVTPPGERYDLVWDDEEVAQIVAVLRQGLRVFRSVIAPFR